MWSRVTRLHSSVFLRQAGNTEMTLAGKMMMIPWWYQVLIDSFNYLPRFSSYQKEPQTTRTTFYWAAMDHHQRNILTVWENINCYQRSLIMDVLCIRAWLEMTDISSILVTTSFIIIATLSFNISHQDLPFITGTSHVMFLTLLWERWEVWGKVKC